MMTGNNIRRAALGAVLALAVAVAAAEPPSRQSAANPTQASLLTLAPTDISVRPGTSPALEAPRFSRNTWRRDADIPDAELASLTAAARAGDKLAHYRIAVRDIVMPASAGAANARATLIALAQAGLPQAQAWYGLQLATGGYGVPRDDKAALMWFERAAAQGNVTGLIQVFMDRMLKLPSDGAYTPALAYLERAATSNADEPGVAEAAYALGYFPGIGKGVKYDAALGVRWFVRAAAKGDVLAEYALAYFREKGYGTEIDLPKAMQGYERAAERGYLPAMRRLAREPFGPEVDAKPGTAKAEAARKALHYTVKAAIAGDLDALVRVAHGFESGTLSPADHPGLGAEALTDRQIVMIYEGSAKRGNAQAMFRIGSLYERGRYTPPNAALANDWYELAWRHRSADAAAKLGRQVVW